MLCINEMDLPSPIATIKISKMYIDYLNKKKRKKYKQKRKNVLEIKDKSKIDRIREIKLNKLNCCIYK